MITISLQAQPFLKKDNLFGETVFLEGSPRNEDAASTCLYSVVKDNDIIEIHSNKLVWLTAGKSFTKQWLNTSNKAINVPQNKTSYYFTGGNKRGKQFGYKKLIFKNIYPNIDLIYELIKGELKYSFYLHEFAKISDIQFKFSGVEKVDFSPSILQLNIDSSSWKEDKIRLISAENAKNIQGTICNFRKIQSDIFGFELSNPKLKPPFVVDPFIRKSKVLYGYYTGNPSSIVDIEYDLNGNLYIYGGDGLPKRNTASLDSSIKYPFDPRYNNYYRVAKYSINGSLLWVFIGYDTAANYLQNGYPSGITLEKDNETVFCTHSNYLWYYNTLANTKALIQLSRDGVFNDYSPELIYNKTSISVYNTIPPLSSDPKSKIIGNGMLIDTTKIQKGFFVYDYDSSSKYLDVVKITNPIMNGPQNGPVVYGINSNSSIYNVFYSFSGKYDIRINKLTKNYAELWRTDSFLITPYRILGGYMIQNPSVSSHTANLLSCNDSNLVYFDGHTIKVYKTSTGKIICQDTLQNKLNKLSYGVAIDPCNNIFVAGDSSKIFCYSLKDTMLTLQKTLNIDNYKHRYLFDVEYDAQRNLIYATGDSILASVASPFSCVDSSMTTVLDSTTSICWQPIVAGLKKAFSESVYSFEWTDTTTNKIVRSVNKLGNATDTLANPTEGHTYKLRIMKNKTNLGLFKDLYFNVFKSSKDTQTFNLCSGDSFVNQRSKKVFYKGAIFNDTLVNFIGCDSVITLKLIFHPTFIDSFRYESCMGETLAFGNRKFTSSANYIDSLTTIWGCDSLIWRDIHFFGTRDTQRVHLCNGSVFKFGLHSYSKSGFYIDTFVNFKGCDSIICTKLWVHSDTSLWIKHIVCQGDSIKLAGKFRVKPGDYNDSLKTFWGCDSVVKHQLIVHPFNKDTINIHLCKNQKVVINGKTYQASSIVTEVYKNVYGCDSTVVYNIKQSNMIADFDIDTTQSPMMVFKNKSLGNAKFLWDFGDNFFDSINKDPSHTYNNDEPHYVKICLTIVDSFGCNDTICQSIEISKLVYWLFNSFSPGSDGYNDLFKIGHRNGSFNYNLMVYNRWGALVYQTQNANIKDQSKFWNGKVMNTGADCPAGSYFVLYQLYLNGTNNPPKEIHGVITLIRE